MHVRTRTLRLSRIAVAAAAVALVVGLTACGSDDGGSDTATTSATATDTAAHDHGEEHDHDDDHDDNRDDDRDDAHAPSADALRGGLDTFVDPQVSTADKAKIVVGGEKLTANIDQMNRELAGYGELTFAVADIDVDDEQATAQVTITSPHGTAPAMPMTWQHDHGSDSWKLSEQSACVLLGFAKAPCVPA
ncbi:hypothetical protein [Nocardia paucivorans]|uniref:hypothetical protein n=1 Tax=Nocardia paucivorans TaxID=114259 RepID=UPI0002DF2070|nr:hypothetical protein [Nocardia paucivorans]